jgi:hypothetical protein
LDFAAIRIVEPPAGHSLPVSSGQPGIGTTGADFSALMQQQILPRQSGQRSEMGGQASGAAILRGVALSRTGGDLHSSAAPTAIPTLTRSPFEGLQPTRPATNAEEDGGVQNEASPATCLPADQPTEPRVLVPLVAPSAPSPNLPQSRASAPEFSKSKPGAQRPAKEQETSRGVASAHPAQLVARNSPTLQASPARPASPRSTSTQAAGRAADGRAAQHPANFPMNVKAAPSENSRSLPAVAEATSLLPGSGWFPQTVPDGKPSPATNRRDDRSAGSVAVGSLPAQPAGADPAQPVDTTSPKPAEGQDPQLTNAGKGEINPGLSPTNAQDIRTGPTVRTSSDGKPVKATGAGAAQPAGQPREDFPRASFREAPASGTLQPQSMSEAEASREVRSTRPLVAASLPSGTHLTAEAAQANASSSRPGSSQAPAASGELASPHGGEAREPTPGRVARLSMSPGDAKGPARRADAQGDVPSAGTESSTGQGAANLTAPPHAASDAPGHAAIVVGPASNPAPAAGSVPPMPASGDPAPARTVAPGAHTAEVPAGVPFERMDSAAAPQTLESSPQRLSVGVRSPELGWVEIRTHRDAGQVSATLATGSAASHSTLSTQLPSVREYLAEHQVRIDTLASERFSASSGGRQSGDRPSGRNARETESDAPSSAPSLSDPETDSLTDSLSYISVRV